MFTGLSLVQYGHGMKLSEILESLPGDELRVGKWHLQTVVNHSCIFGDLL